MAIEGGKAYMYYQNGIVSCHTSKSLQKLRGKQGICTKCTCKKIPILCRYIDSKSRFTDGVGYTSQIMCICIALNDVQMYSGIYMSTIVHNM